MGFQDFVHKLQSTFDEIVDIVTLAFESFDTGGYDSAEVQRKLLNDNIEQLSKDKLKELSRSIIAQFHNIRTNESGEPLSPTAPNAMLHEDWFCRVSVSIFCSQNISRRLHKLLRSVQNAI